MNREQYLKKMAELKASAELKLKSSSEAGDEPDLKEYENLDPDHLRHELSVHRIELEMQVDEYLRSQEQLTREKLVLQTQLSAIPAAYFTLDTTGKIISTNEAAAKLFQNRQSHIGKTVFEHLVLADDRLVYNHALKQCKKQPDQIITYSLQLDFNHKVYKGLCSLRFSQQENSDGNFYILFVAE